MSDLILIFAAFFALFIGLQLIGSFIEFGFAVADKVLQNFSRIAKAPFNVIKFFYLKWKKHHEYYTVTPIYDTRSEIQRLSQPTLNKTLGHEPVQIEYVKPSKNL